MLDLLLQLVRKSLVVAEESRDGAERYRLLETLRQYAHERLIAAGEAETVHGRHAKLLPGAGGGGGATQHAGRAWPERLLIEHDNLRAAMRWLIECNAVEQAVRLGGLLYTMWVFGGYLTEGRAQLRTLLALPGAVARVRGLGTARLVCWLCGVLQRATTPRPAPGWSRRSRCGGRSVTRSSPIALSFLGQAAREQGDYAAARTWLEESLALAREPDDQNCVATRSTALGRSRMRSETTPWRGRDTRRAWRSRGEWITGSK